MADEQVTTIVQMTGQETVEETFHPAGDANARTLIHDGFNIGPKTFNDGSLVIKPTAIIPMKITIGASAEIIDLTAAEQAFSRTIDLTDAKLFSLLLVADAANEGDITITGGDAGDANPYLLFGTSGSIVLGPGEYLAKGSTSQFNLPAVAAASRYIKIAGTEDDVLELLAYFGETPA